MRVNKFEKLNKLRFKALKSTSFYFSRIIIIDFNTFKQILTLRLDIVKNKLLCIISIDRSSNLNKNNVVSKFTQLY